MLAALILSAGAGIVGAGLGGLIGLLLGKRSGATVGSLLSFSAGVMLGVVFFDLVPTSIELSNVYIAIAGIVFGVLCIHLMNLIIDLISQRGNLQFAPVKVIARKNKSMLRAGIMMFFAISVHNLPEGIAIGSGASHSVGTGFVLAVLITLHDIPEGISVCVPLVAGNMNRGKAFLLTLVSGIPTLIGGWIGGLLGSASQAGVALSLAFAGGAMLYVTVGEIFPQIVLINDTKIPALFAVIGVLFGMIMIRVLG